MSYCRTVPPKTKTRSSRSRRERHKDTEMEDDYRDTRRNYRHHHHHHQSSGARSRPEPLSMPEHTPFVHGHQSSSRGHYNSGHMNEFGYHGTTTQEPHITHEGDGDTWEDSSCSNSSSYASAIPHQSSLRQLPGSQPGNQSSYDVDNEGQTQGNAEGVYRVIQPNPARNTKLKQIALAEEESHTEFVQRKKERIVQQYNCQEPQRVGGSKLSEEEICDLRKKQEQDLRRAKIQKMIDREDRAKQAKQKEQEEIDKYKQQQREKAEKQEKRKKEENQTDLQELRRKRLLRFDQK